MKTCTSLVSGIFALASFPLWAQQPPPANPTGHPRCAAKPFKHGDDASEQFIREPGSTRRTDEPNQWRTCEQAGFKDRQEWR